MIARYYEYNHLSPIMESFTGMMNELNCKYYASELLNKLLKNKDFDLDNSIRKAVAILRLTGIPVQNHFISIYRSGLRGIRKDWKLSELASSLVILSCESSDGEIELIQQELLDYLDL